MADQEAKLKEVSSRVDNAIAGIGKDIGVTDAAAPTEEEEEKKVEAARAKPVERP